MNVKQPIRQGAWDDWKNSFARVLMATLALLVLSASREPAPAQTRSQSESNTHGAQNLRRTQILRFLSVSEAAVSQ